MSEPRPPYTRERVVELLAEVERRLGEPETFEDEHAYLRQWRWGLQVCLTRWDAVGSMEHQIHLLRTGLYWMRLAMEMEHEEPDSEVLYWARYILIEQERTDTRPDDAPILDPDA